MYEPVGRPQPVKIAMAVTEGVFYPIVQLVAPPGEGRPAQFAVRDVHKDPVRALREGHLRLIEGLENLSVWKLGPEDELTAIWGADNGYSPAWALPGKPLECNDRAFHNSLSAASRAYIENGGQTGHIVQAAGQKGGGEHGD